MKRHSVLEWQKRSCFLRLSMTQVYSSCSKGPERLRSILARSTLCYQVGNEKLTGTIGNRMESVRHSLIIAEAIKYTLEKIIFCLQREVSPFPTSPASLSNVILKI